MIDPAPLPHRRSRLRVVLFSGGRGAGALVSRLSRHPSIDLTLAINGYDDGASTGEVRRFLGDSLGPSDFRKNASRLATDLATAPADLIRLLDERLPVGIDRAGAQTTLDAACAAAAESAGASTSARAWVPVVRDRLTAFWTELNSSGSGFDFGDCSVGNLVFAGSFLRAGRRFNAAVADYGHLLGVPADVIQNVTDGTNAFLVAERVGGGLLASEAAVVDSRNENQIDQIYLIDHRISEAEAQELSTLSAAERHERFVRCQAIVGLNPVVASAIARADLIIYAPGTQHSSLFPSYLTPGLSTAIASNQLAIKLIVTNLQRDAEIAGASAVDLIDRALYYLRDKGRLTIPTPCLVTHYLLNDPGGESATAYVPLGAVESFEDPRLVRIGHYEDGVSGRHDAEKILSPFVDAMLGGNRPQTAAVYLHDTSSPNKVTQTLLEMVRGGAAELPFRVTVAHDGPPIDREFLSSLPFSVQAVADADATAFLRAGQFNYVVLMESSGMYRGEDAVALLTHLAFPRLDAAWGSRRLSPRDVEAALQLLYKRRWLQAATSHWGSHVLSLLYLVLYGRYVSDTLSGLRAVRGHFLDQLTVAPGHKLANHQLLAAMLSERAEFLELPVSFLPIAPERVKRTSVLDGLRAIAEIIWRRLHQEPRRARRGASPVTDGAPVLKAGK